MIEYICIEDEEELKDNISDSGSKVVHMKREVNGYFIHVISLLFHVPRRKPLSCWPSSRCTRR